MSNTLQIYTDASVIKEKSYIAFVAFTEDTHVMSRVYELEEDNIYEAEKQAVITAIREIPQKPYKAVRVYVDNQAAICSLRTMVNKGVEPFDRFDNIIIDKIEAHQTNSNPNKIADMLASAGRCYYDNGSQPRALYHLQYPSRIAANFDITS